MKDRFGNWVDSTQLDYEIINTIQKYQSELSNWTALLERQLVHPQNRYFDLNPKKEKTPKGFREYDLNIRFKNISTKQIEILLIISQYSGNQLLESLTNLAIDNLVSQELSEQKVRLSKFRKNLKYTRLYLLDSEMKKDSFFGRLINLLKRIQSEVKYGLKNNNRLIFSSPFWIPLSSKGIKRYTGWARHQRSAKGTGSIETPWINIYQGSDLQNLDQNEIESKQDSILKAIEIYFGGIE